MSSGHDSTLVMKTLEGILSNNPKCWLESFDQDDWQVFLDRLDVKALSTLLLDQILSHGLTSQIPPVALRRLENTSIDTLGRMLGFASDLEKVLEALNEQEIYPILLKGSFFAFQLYKEANLRPMSDLDLLVAEDQILLADETLRNQLWQSQLSSEELDFLLSSGNKGGALNSLLYYPKETSGAKVHLHWHILNSSMDLRRVYPALKLEFLLQYLEPCGVGLGYGQVFKREILLLHVAEHALKHSYKNLNAFTDAAVLLGFGSFRNVNISAVNLDWDKLEHLAKHFNLLLPLRHLLTALEDLSGSAAPDSLRQRPQSLKAHASGDWRVVDRILHDEMSLGSNFFQYLQMLPNLQTKAGFVFGTLFPRKEILALRAKKPLSEIGVMDYVKRLGRGFRLGMKLTGKKSNA